MVGWMEDGGGGRPLQAQVSLRHLLLSATLRPLSPSPCPLLALSHHYVLILTRPSRLALRRNGSKKREEERERGRVCDWPPSICHDSKIK